MRKPKRSEARILIYLAQVDRPYKYARAISNKLNIGYNYVLSLVSFMAFKGWIRAYRHRTKVFYEVVSKTQLNKAKEMIANETKHNYKRIHNKQEPS